MKDTRPLWLVVGLALGWALANPRRVTRALTWCDRQFSDLFNAVRRRGEVRVSGYGRPPTSGEAAAHRLGTIEGLQEAEGILSDLLRGVQTRVYLNGIKPHLTAEREALTRASVEVLERRLYHEGVERDV